MPDKDACWVGTALVLRAAEIAEALEQLGGPWLIVNPAPVGGNAGEAIEPSLFHPDEIQALLTRSGEEMTVPGADRGTEASARRLACLGRCAGL